MSLTTQLQDDRQERSFQPARLAGADGHVRQLPAEDAPLTRGLVAEETPRANLELDRVSVPGQVRDRAGVAAVDPGGAATAERAKGPLVPEVAEMPTRPVSMLRLSR